MIATDYVRVVWREDGSATVYGRIVARDGTGTSVTGEGKALQQANVSSITYAVYDEADPTTPTASGSVTVASSVFDTLQTSDPVWDVDDTGYNFRHDLAASAFPGGATDPSLPATVKVYRVEYKITTTGGTVAWAVYRGQAAGVYTS